MPKKTLDKEIIDKIIELRKLGHSLPEIRRITGKGNATVFKYAKGVEILPQYIKQYSLKQGGSRRRMNMEWENAHSTSSNILHSLDRVNKIVILASLYWAEGRKKDFDLINSDPELIRVFISCLSELGVNPRDLRFSLRLYSDINKQKSIDFWTKQLKIDKNQITSVNILIGKKEGKLEYGMCRVRILKGGKYFKQIISLINIIKKLI